METPDNNTIQFVYEYAVQSIKDLDESYAALMAKSGLVFLFDAIVLLGTSLASITRPVSSVVLMICQATLIASLVFAFLTVRPSKRGSMVLTSEFAKDWMQFPVSQLQDSLINQLATSIEKYIEIRDRRSLFARYAITLMFVSGCLFALSLLCDRLISVFFEFSRL